MFASNFLKLLRAPVTSTRSQVVRHVARPSTFAFRTISTSRVNHAGKWVYLGNLPWRLELEEIKDRAEQFGSLESINMPDDEYGKFSGFANVEFRLPEDAEKFYNFARENELTFQGRRARVELFDSPQTQIVRRKFEATRPPNNVLYVGGFSPNITKEELEHLFAPFGPIVRVHIARYPDGQSRGFAHVQYQDVESAQSAVKNHQDSPFILSNRRMRIDFALSRAEEALPSSKLYFHSFKGTLEELKEALAAHEANILNIIFLKTMNGIIKCTSLEDAKEIRRVYDQTTSPSGHAINLFYAKPPRKNLSETSEGDAQRRTSYGSDWGGSQRTSEYGGGLRSGSFDY